MLGQIGSPLLLLLLLLLLLRRRPVVLVARGRLRCLDAESIV